MANPTDQKNEILEGIRNLFGNTSVPQSVTKDLLEEIAEEAASMAEGLEGEDE